jgi:hypothetical protein
MKLVSRFHFREKACTTGDSVRLPRWLPAVGALRNAWSGWKFVKKYGPPFNRVNLKVSTTDDTP